MQELLPALKHTRDMFVSQQDDGARAGACVPWNTLFINPDKWTAQQPFDLNS